MILNIATCASTFIQYIVLKLQCSISVMQKVLEHIKNEEYPMLLSQDQLTHSQKEGKAFVEFSEYLSFNVHSFRYVCVRVHVHRVVMAHHDVLPLQSCYRNQGITS